MDTERISYNIHKINTKNNENNWIIPTLRKLINMTSTILSERPVY